MSNKPMTVEEVTRTIDEFLAKYDAMLPEISRQLARTGRYGDRSNTVDFKRAIGTLSEISARLKRVPR